MYVLPHVIHLVAPDPCEKNLKSKFKGKGAPIRLSSANEMPTLAMDARNSAKAFQTLQPTCCLYLGPSSDACTETQ